MSAPMSARTRWSTPGRRSAPARRSASQLPYLRRRRHRRRAGAVAGGADHHRGQLLHRRALRSGRRRDRGRRLGAVDGRVHLTASTKIVDRHTGEIFQGRVPPYSVVVPGSLPRRAGQAVALLRGHHQDAWTNAHALQDLDQRAVAGLSTDHVRGGMDPIGNDRGSRPQFAAMQRSWDGLEPEALTGHLQDGSRTWVWRHHKGNRIRPSR